MKVLDRYILTQFLISFFSAFFIIVLIFVFHTIWLYIDEFAGKGLSLWIIIKFIGLMLPNLIPIILPLTVVLSSIMTMGSLSESYEFAAMKASGISLLRASRVLVIFMLILSGIVFFTINHLQPEAFRKAHDLRSNIQKVQPSLAISEGIFTNIENYSIKVHKKTGERGQFLHDIIIHQSEYGLNKTVIKAKKGELIGEGKNANLLQLVLQDGTYYKEITNAKSYETFPFAKTNFKTYVLNVDVSSLNKNVDFSETSQGDSYKTMNISELSYTIDSLKRDFNTELSEFGEGIFRRTGITFLNQGPRHIQKKDTIRSIEALKNKYDFPYKQAQIYEVALSNNESLLGSADIKLEEIRFKSKLINIFQITMSDKFALAFTCFVLFFVAAPLGAFIRKGGIGMPLVAAMGLFLSYYFLGMFVKSISENGGIHPVLAPWIPTLILLPIGFYLTIRVNQDKPIFQIGEIVSKLKNKFKKKKNE